MTTAQSAVPPRRADTFWRTCARVSPDPAAREQLRRALQMPKSWVTDEYYRKLAEDNLKEVNRHLH